MKWQDGDPAIPKLTLTQQNLPERNKTRRNATELNLAHHN
jgi:hypothetical protein